MSLEPLNKYLPENTLGYVSRLLEKHNIIIKITNPRKSRLGSFRGNGKQASVINISGSLNPYAFLITLVHEISHLKVYESYKNRVQPHGKEWKNTFTQLMMPLLIGNIFPEDLNKILLKHFKNPKAASSSDVDLARTLKKYDKGESLPVLEELPYDAHFQWREQKLFQKKEKLRKRYRCIEIATGRIYLFSPLAEVLPIRS